MTVVELVEYISMVREFTGKVEGVSESNRKMALDHLTMAMEEIEMGETGFNADIIDGDLVYRGKK